MTPSPAFLNLNNSLRHNLAQPLRPCKQIGVGNFDPKLFLTNLGIIHHHPCPFTPKQNVRVERKNCDVVEKYLSLLAHASVLLSFWHYAFQSTVYLINRLHQLFPTKHHLSCSITLILPMTQFVFLVVLVFPFSNPIIKISSNIALLNVSSLGLAPIMRVIFVFKRTPVVFTSCHVVFNELSFLFHFLFSPSSSSPTHQPPSFLFSPPSASFYPSPLSSHPSSLPHNPVSFPLHSLLLSPLPHRALRP